MSEETISIFILKAQLHSLTQAESYLRNRKWIVGSSTNLREALAYIVQKQPKYVMITSDHPNKKVRALPKMLIQAFPVRVIGFSEKGSGLSVKALHEMALEYNLYSPVSGPAIERMVLKTRKDEELKAQAAEIASKNPRSDGLAGGSDTITFKGESASGAEIASSFEQARAALTQMLNSDGNDDSSAATSGPKDSSLIFQPGNSTPQPSGPAYWGGQGSQDPNSQNSQGSNSSSQGGAFLKGSTPPQFSGNVATNYDPKLSGNIATNFDPKLSGNVASTKDPDLSGNVATKDNPKLSGQAAPGTPQAPRSSASNPAGGSFQDGTSDWGVLSSQNPNRSSTTQDSNSTENSAGKAALARRRGQQAPVMESEYIPKTQPKEYRITRSEERLGKRNDSIIVRGTEQALNESVNLKGAETAQPVEKSQNIACITIESPKFSGYLVCAMGKNRKIDRSFFDLIQQRLFHFLRTNGEQIKESDSMNLKIQEVDFTDWAFEQAEFLRKSVHEGDEVAMAFFPSTELDIHLSDSASDKMAKMSLNDLKEDVALEFDLYIFMPENNKYLLYTPKGMPFYGHQKNRLSEKGITHMHLRRESSHNVKKYKAQNFLNDKIAAYKASLHKEA